MTNRGIAVLGLRLFALYLVVDGLRRLPDAYLALSDPAVAAGSLHYWLLLGAHLGPLALGLLLWPGAGPVASAVLPRRTAAPQQEAPGIEDWYALVFAAVGLLIALDGLPPLLELAAAAQRQQEVLEPLTPEQATALATAALRVLLGLAVLLGSRGFGGLVARLRTAGWPQPVSP